MRFAADAGSLTLADGPLRACTAAPAAHQRSPRPRRGRALRGLGASSRARARPTGWPSRSARTARWAAASASTSRTRRSSRSRATRTRRSRAGACARRARPRASSHEHPAREYKVKYRRPHATEWEELDLDTAMDMIADRLIAARDAGWEDVDEHGHRLQPDARLRAPRRRHARQRGELPDQEVLLGHGRAADREPGPHMTLEHGPRSGDLVRARRRHHLPAGPRQQRLHPDHGLEHGREPPGGLPVGGRGQEARRQDHPRRPPLHAHERLRRPLRAAARRQRHRLPRRHRALHPRGGSRVQGVRRALHQRGDDRLRGLPRHRGPRRAVLGLGSRDAHLRPRVLAVRGHGGGGGVGAAGARRAHGTGRPRRPRRRARGGRAAAPRRDAAAPALRLPAAAQALRPLHARARRADLRRLARAVPRGVRGAVRELGPRAHERPLLRRRLDPAHGRRAVHPHRLDHPAAAGQHRPAGRRHHRPARARVDPGLDRHPDALRHPARLPADARGRGARVAAGLHRAELAAGRLLGQHGRLHRLAAEGVVGRRGDAPTTTSASATCRA